LASYYGGTGRTADAIAIGEQLVADRERLLSPKHPDTLVARANLTLYYRQAARSADTNGSAAVGLPKSADPQEVRMRVDLGTGQSVTTSECLTIAPRR
jgi:hypothetical protein